MENVIYSEDHTVNCVNIIPLFDILNNEQKNKIYNLVEHRNFKAGEIIYRPGDIAAAIHIVNHGKVRIYRLADNGKEQLIRMLVPGEFTGELALFKEGIYEAYAECLEDTRICMIHHRDFKNMLEKFPLLSTKMLEVLASRLSFSEEQAAWVATESVRERLIHFLIRSASLDKNNNILVTLTIKRKELASYLGTTPETLSREWTKLKNEGIIKEITKTLIKLVGLDMHRASCSI